MHGKQNHSSSLPVKYVIGFTSVSVNIPVRLFDFGCKIIGVRSMMEVMNGISFKASYVFDNFGCFTLTAIAALVPACICRYTRFFLPIKDSSKLRYNVNTILLKFESAVTKLISCKALAVPAVTTEKR